MSILGLTIDYGPYGFLDRYNPDHIFNGSGKKSVNYYIKMPRFRSFFFTNLNPKS